MMRKYSGLVAMILTVALLVSCSGGETATSGAASSAESGMASSAAGDSTGGGALEGFSEETIAYLADKDFSGQTLIVGVWGGDYERIIQETVIPALETTGASVELLLGGAGDRTAKLYAEMGNPTMDVAYINIHTAAQGAIDGVVEAPDPSLPVYDDLYDFALNEGGYGAAVGPIGIQYSTDAFPEPPTWEDLWAPEYKGKIAFPVWPGTGGDALLGIVGRMEGGDEHDVDVVFEKLAELKPVPLVFTSNDELAQYMQQGLVVAAPNTSAYAEVLSDQYDNIDFVFPEEPGTILAMDVLSIVEGAPNRDLALAYAQVALDPKVQTIFAEEAYFGPTNSLVELDEETADRVIYGEEEVSSLIELDWPFVIEARQEYTERWNRELIEN